MLERVGNKSIVEKYNWLFHANNVKMLEINNQKSMNKNKEGI